MAWGLWSSKQKRISQKYKWRHGKEVCVCCNANKAVLMAIGKDMNNLNTPTAPIAGSRLQNRAFWVNIFKTNVNI